MARSGCSRLSCVCVDCGDSTVRAAKRGGVESRFGDHRALRVEHLRGVLPAVAAAAQRDARDFADGDMESMPVELEALQPRALSGVIGTVLEGVEQCLGVECARVDFHPGSEAIGGEGEVGVVARSEQQSVASLEQPVRHVGTVCTIGVSHSRVVVPDLHGVDRGEGGKLVDAGEREIVQAGVQQCYERTAVVRARDRFGVVVPRRWFEVDRQACGRDREDGAVTPRGRAELAPMIVVKVGVRSVRVA
jgi:hypothetical protein